MAEAFIVRRGGGGTAANSIEHAEIVLDNTTYEYDGESHAPKVTSVTLKGKELVEGQDYVYISTPETDAGNYNVLVLGVMEYGNGVNVQWQITQATGSVSLSSKTLTVKGIMGTTNESITVTKPELCKVVAESQSPEFATAEIVDGTKVKITSVKAGKANVIVKVSDKNFTDAEETLAVTVEKADGSISVQPASLTIEGELGTEGTTKITHTGDGQITVSQSEYVSSKIEGDTLTLTSTAEGSDRLTISIAETENYTGASCTLDVETKLFTAHIYGVRWDKTTSTKLSRTDDAALFEDPTPAVNGTGGSSPFDNLMPWSGMTKKTIDGNEMVEIPKFWFKWTNEGGKLTLQISDSEMEGFHVSPAHANRGDGKGERDVVYIGRYHCDSSYKSVSGASPIASITRDTARQGIKKLGDGYYMEDYAMWWTRNMLYLVEYADWDAQAAIAYGNGGSSKINTGSTDTMSYHTGTMASSKETFDARIQYRYIEAPWANVREWIDGIRFQSGSVYVFNNPSESNDSSGGTLIGTTPSTGCISDWMIPSASGYEWAVFPSATSGTDYTIYCADGFSVSSSYVVLNSGGNYNNTNRFYGPFYFNGHSVTYSSSGLGARLQKLP